MDPLTNAAGGDADVYDVTVIIGNNWAFESNVTCPGIGRKRFTSTSCCDITDVTREDEAMSIFGRDVLLWSTAVAASCCV